jgi:hypothetical protein
MLIQALICILKTDLYMKNNLNLEREIGKKREISLFPSREIGKKQGNFPFSLKGNWEKTRKFPFFPQVLKTA